MDSKRIRIISVLAVLLVVVVGLISLKNDMEYKSIESKRVTVLDGHKNAKDVANKCISLFQLDEVGAYNKVKESIYSYLSDDLKSLYFPGKEIKGVKPISKLTITKTVSEKLGNGHYMVKVEFTQVGREYKDKMILVEVKNGLVTYMESIR